MRKIRSKKEISVTLRVSRSERDAWEKASIVEDKSLSSWLRERANDAIRNESAP